MTNLRPAPQRTRVKSAIPRGHPASVYIDQKPQVLNPLMKPKSETKSSFTKLADLRNPFKKWKPNQRNRQTTKMLKEINKLSVQHKMAQFTHANMSATTNFTGGLLFSRQKPVY